MFGGVVNSCIDKNGMYHNNLGQFTEKSDNQPINVDTKILIPISFTWEEYNKYKDKNEVEKTYNNNIKGHFIEHKTIGKIYFYDIGLEETEYRNRRKNYYILTKIDKIIENSEYDRTEPPKHKRDDDIKCFHILYGKIQLPSKTQILIITIAEDTKGKKYYYYKPISTEKRKEPYYLRSSH